MSGGPQKEITKYSQNIASDEYSNYLNQLFQLAGMGQQADTAKANVVTGLANPMAQARYGSEISGTAAGANTLNLAASLGGAALGAGMGKGGASTNMGTGGSASGGTYNPAYLNQASGL